MNLNLSKQDRIYKKIFDLKPPQRDGLILKIHHTDKTSQKIRLINSCFDKTGSLLALSDHEGNLFVIDLSLMKFWNLPKITTSCTVLKFSQLKENEVLVGTQTGRIQIVDIQNGFIVGELAGHECPVLSLSFASFLCLSSSICEAVLWDLRTNTKIQILNLANDCSLKKVAFIPVTNDIITCFNDDVIQIWQFGTFEIKNQLAPLIWFNHEVKNLTFTQDGKIMVVVCRSPHLALFILSTFKLLKFITLPEYIQTLKHAEFTPQINDGGSNKILAILSGRGSIYFYDIEQNLLISELVASYEISKFDYRGNYFVCLLCSGDVNIYDVIQYIVVPVKLKAIRAPPPGKKFKSEKKELIRDKIRDILEIDKLRLILKECGEYPANYRMKIWEHLLDLPNNVQQYNAIINNRMIVSFDDLCKKYPLRNKNSLKNLKQLLDNLVTWCPFFYHVEYLPVLVFPFVKVFANKPLSCFEAVCTIIVNWCQFWFEYFPLPPVNILSMIENLLMEQDPELLSFYKLKKITPELYAWPILRSAFSEVLVAPSWRILWDHILTNEPSFLLCAVVAYNILQRKTLLILKELEKFRCYFATFHPIDVKKLIGKSYKILKETSPEIHPRLYLHLFEKLKLGEYPNFCDYPKTILDLKTDKDLQMKSEMKKLKSQELDLFRQRLKSLEQMEVEDLKDEERNRILELEGAIKTQLLEERDRVDTYYERLASLGQQFREENRVLASLKTKIAKEQQKKSRTRHLKSVLDDVKLRKREEDYELTKIEDELLLRYSELLKNKYRIEQLLGPSDNLSSTKKSFIDRHHEELAGEIDYISKIDKPHEYLKSLNLATGLDAMDNLIEKIQTEINNGRKGVVDESAANRRVLELQAETRELVNEVNNLIHLLTDLRNVDVEG